MISVILAAGLLASINTTALVSISHPVKFDQCLLVIKNSASDFDAEPVDLVKTTDMRMVEFTTEDGTVLVICNRIDQKMVITNSPIN